MIQLQFEIVIAIFHATSIILYSGAVLIANAVKKKKRNARALNYTNRIGSELLRYLNQ